MSGRRKERFVESLTRDLELTEAERGFLERADATSFDSAYGVLTASRSLGEERDGIRRALLLKRLEPLISPWYRKVVDGGWEPPDVTTGAKPPTRLGDNLPISGQRWPATGKDPDLSDVPALNLLPSIRSRWDAREQGGSSACIAFATAASVEWQVAARGGPLASRSASFLQAKTAGMPEADAQGFRKFGHMREALRAEGVCLDALWAEAALAGAAPDKGCEDDAEATRATGGFYWDNPPPQPRPAGVGRTVYEILANGGGTGPAGRPVGIALPMFRDPAGEDTNWTTPFAMGSGEVRGPPPGWVPEGGHAVLVVGFQPAPGESFGGWFVFRNSWGSRFATSPARRGTPRLPRIGYGAITARYVDEHCWEIFAPLLDGP